MYVNGSDEFNQVIESANNSALKTRAVFTDDGSILEKFHKLVGYISSNNSNEIQIGSTDMSYIDVEIFTDEILTSREFRLECGAELSDGTIEYAPIGYFTVQKPDGDLDYQKFKAFDRMQRFERPYTSSLTYPTTSDMVLHELCFICGVTLATPIENPVEITEKLQGYTCREVLGYVAGLYGKFACFDRFGELNLCWYSETPTDKQIGLIWQFTKSQSDFTIEKVSLHKDTETSYESGSGISTLNHSNPLATQEIADSIMASVGGFTYNGATIVMLDDIRLDPWDVIKVTYLDGNDYLVPCMAITQNFTDGSTTIKASAKSDVESEYSFTGPTIKYLDRVAYNLLLANQVIATKVDAEYVQSHAITTDNLDAITAQIKTLVVEEIDGLYADIRLANIDVANIDKTNIGLLFAEVGLIDRATIVDGHITGFLDAVEINANKITAGTLVADRILLSGEKGSVLFALNNLGELTSTNVNTLDGYILTDRTISADKIIAKSITANELDVDKIFGNEAVLNKIVSQEIFSNAVATNTVVVGKANRDEVVADNLLEFPYYEATHTQSNIEWTVLEDGTVKANGTANALSQFYFNLDTTLDLKPNTTYTLSGCPSGGSASTYGIRIFINYRLDGQVLYRDIGDGVTFTTPSNYQHCRIMADVSAGIVIDNLIFKPMLEKGSVAHPYTEYLKGGTGIANNLYREGTTLIDGNKIYTGTVTADKIDVKNLFAQDINMTGKFTSQGKAQLAPGIEEINTVKAYILNQITLTDAQKTLYDVNVDGKVNVGDFTSIKMLTLGYKSIDEWLEESGYNLPESTITTVINSSNPQKVIEISATNVWGREIEVYFGLDGLSVPKVETNNLSAFGIAVEEEITCLGDVYANYGTDTQVSLLGIQDKMDYLQPHPYSLATDLTLTTTQSLYNVVSGRKFSDYGMLIVTMGSSQNDVRATLTIPRTIFDGSDTIGRIFYLDCFSNNGQTFNQIAVTFVSDTQFRAWLTTSTTVVKQLNIYGVKTDAALSGRGGTTL